MTNREKILHELDHQVADADWCDNDWKDNVPIWMLRGALALLREQDPVKPIAEGKWPYRWFRCGNCEEPLYGPWNYCPKCGRRVKWDD